MCFRNNTEWKEYLAGTPRQHSIELFKFGLTSCVHFNKPESASLNDVAPNVQLLKSAAFQVIELAKLDDWLQHFVGTAPKHIMVRTGDKDRIAKHQQCEVGL